jgi:hypothetical protein
MVPAHHYGFFFKRHHELDAGNLVSLRLPMWRFRNFVAGDRAASGDFALLGSSLLEEARTWHCLDKSQVVGSLAPSLAHSPMAMAHANDTSAIA